jgi:hypothetical protein
MKWQEFAVFPEMGITAVPGICGVKPVNAIMIARGRYGAIAGEKS